MKKKQNEVNTSAVITATRLTVPGRWGNNRKYLYKQIDQNNPVEKKEKKRRNRNEAGAGTV